MFINTRREETARKALDKNTPQVTLETSCKLIEDERNPDVVPQDIEKG